VAKRLNQILNIGILYQDLKNLVKIQDGGDRHLGLDRHVKFFIFVNISVWNESICIRFGTLIDFGHAKVTVSKVNKFVKIQDGGGHCLDFRSPAISQSRMKIFASIWHADRL